MLSVPRGSDCAAQGKTQTFPASAREFSWIGLDNEGQRCSVHAEERYLGEDDLPESGSRFRPFLPDQQRVALMILRITGGVTFLILCLSRLMGVHRAVTQDGTRCL